MIKYKCKCIKNFFENKNPQLKEKTVNYLACNYLLEEKLELRNFIHDSIDMQSIRQLLLRPRHLMLIPILAINLAKTKKKSCGGYNSSY